MAYKLIIFDLDGTLLSTLEDLTDSTNFALKSFGYPTKTIEQVRSYVGNGVALLIERAIPNGKDNENFEKCLKIFKENYSKNMYNKTSSYPNILEMLKDLRNNGCKIAVVSNKFDMAVKELCEKYFPNLIDIAIGENEAEGIKKKPAPDTVFQAMKAFEMKNDNCIYVGDSEVDIMTARNSGMPCISVTWGFKTREFLINNGGRILVDKPSEIVEYVVNSTK